TTVTVNLSALGDVSVQEAQTLSDSDIYARNTLDDQNRVGLSPNDSARIADGQLTVELPAVSWTAIALG
ncbi:MAG TPA: alpha-L-arabinofuranosidase C-terminal domain-containing protein, partial [Propionibacteriaceae bacterium]